ncbi:MAG: carbohydrate ABC transporter permease, partial [Gemmiger sp.]|nr:carbohydrate ABC transporter permease [Gemmiger sp.]
MHRKNKFLRKKILLALILPLLCLITWWVLYFMGMGALTPLDELQLTLGPALADTGAVASWHLLPTWPTLQPLVELLLDTPAFFGMFWNTCALVLPQLLGQLLVATPAAWAFSRYTFRGRRLLYGGYILLMVLPFQITMVPNYLVLARLGLMDTLWAVVLPGVFSTFPVFITKKGFDDVPYEWIDYIDPEGDEYGYVPLI